MDPKDTPLDKYLPVGSLFRHLREDGLEFFWEKPEDLFSHYLRHSPVESLSNPAGDARQRVRVAAERDAGIC